jgi:hypothetical protein
MAHCTCPRKGCYTLGELGENFSPSSPNPQENHMTKYELSKLKRRKVQVTNADLVDKELQARRLLESMQGRSNTVRVFPKGFSRSADEAREMYFRLAPHYNVRVVELTAEQAEDYLS